MPQTLRDYRRLFRTFINRAQADCNFVQGDDVRTDVLGHLVDAATFLDNFVTLLMLGEKKRTISLTCCGTGSSSTAGTARC
jgi:hypothetical protein